MKTRGSVSRRRMILAVAVTAVLALGAIVSRSVAAEGAQAPDGAKLYRLNCSQCHVERYATERSAAQWKTVMLQMRVRASLTAQDSAAILQYLTSK